MALSAFERDSIAVDDGRLAYYHRHGWEPALILIPGSFDDRRACAGIVEHLDDRRMVVIELRGHGDSWPPPRGGSIELFAEDVLQVVKQVGLRSFFVGGHSIGGMIAKQVASAMPVGVAGVLSIEGWTSHRVLANAFGGETLNTLSSEQLARRDELRLRVMESWTEEQVAEFRTYWTRWDGFDFLAATELPILEMYGDRGRPAPTLHKLRIPDRDNITVQFFEGVSHCLPLECPGEVARACRDFMSRVGRAAGPA